MKKAFILYLSILLSVVIYGQNDSLRAPSKIYHIDYLKAQFAGEIGFLSMGIGSEIFKKRNGEIDIMFGYLPKSIGGVKISTIALKFNYIPWEISLNKDILKFQPLTLGVLVYHAFGKDLDKQLNRDIYERGYYTWPIAIRYGPVIGFRIKRNFKNKSVIKSISFYTEFVSNDIHMYSWLANLRVIPLTRVFNTSFGLKFGF